MKSKLMSLALVLALVAAILGTPAPVSAAAYGTSFVTSITYQNVGTGPADLEITFYPSAGGAPVTWTPAEGALPVNAGASLFIGSVGGISEGFTGSAVLSSNQPVVAVLVQIPQNSTVKNRPLSTGLSSGAANVLVPTVLKGVFNTNTIFVVQNADTVVNDLNVTFVPVSGAPITLTVDNLAVGTAKIYDLAKEGAIPGGFNGSVSISAWKDGTAKTSPANGSVVATSMELSTVNDNVYAFEGTSESGNKLYMPSAFCRYRGGLVNSAYAVQNTEPPGGQAAQVTVAYSSGKSEGPFSVAPGAKLSLPGCGVNNNLNADGFIGSAIITSTGGKIVGIGKITGSGISSAFNGFTAGSARVALPYVRWTESQWLSGARQKANIAIQNVGGDLPAGAVKVRYYDKNGTLVGTHTLGAIPAGAKANSNPLAQGVNQPEFGAPLPGTTAFGGGAIVEGPSGSQLAVLVRVETYNVAAQGGSFGEDYNGIPIP